MTHIRQGPFLLSLQHNFSSSTSFSQCKKYTSPISFPNPSKRLSSHPFFLSQTLANFSLLILSLIRKLSTSYILSLSRKQKMSALKSDKSKRFKMVVKKQKSQLPTKQKSVPIEEKSESTKPMSIVFMFYNFF